MTCITAGTLYLPSLGGYAAAHRPCNFSLLEGSTCSTRSLPSPSWWCLCPNLRNTVVIPSRTLNQYRESMPVQIGGPAVTHRLRDIVTTNLPSLNWHDIAHRPCILILQAHKFEPRFLLTSLSPFLYLCIFCLKFNVSCPVSGTRYYSFAAAFVVRMGFFFCPARLGTSWSHIVFCVLD